LFCFIFFNFYFIFINLYNEFIALKPYNKKCVIRQARHLKKGQKQEKKKGRRNEHRGQKTD